MRGRILKRLILVTLFTSLMTNTLAVGPGFYLGLMFGGASNDGKPEPVQLKVFPNVTGIGPVYRPPVQTVLGKPRSNQYGTRFFLGYKMNKYAGFESGFTFFTAINYTLDLATVQAGNNPFNPPMLPYEACSSTNVRVGAWDFVGRGSIPFGDWFEVYGKAGGAITYLKVSGDLSPDATRDCGRSSESARVRPTVSLGANASLTQNWVIDASWTRLMVGGIINNVDYYALGFAYHFVDRYCGQFLCDE